MSIWILYACAVFGATLILAALLLPMIRWSVRVVDAKHRRRHAVRRRARAKGYIPIYDDQIDPMDLLKR